MVAIALAPKSLVAAMGIVVKSRTWGGGPDLIIGVINIVLDPSLEVSSSLCDVPSTVISTSASLVCSSRGCVYQTSTNDGPLDGREVPLEGHEALLDSEARRWMERRRPLELHWEPCYPCPLLC